VRLPKLCVDMSLWVRLPKYGFQFSNVGATAQTLFQCVIVGATAQTVSIVIPAHVCLLLMFFPKCFAAVHACLASTDAVHGCSSRMHTHDGILSCTSLVATRATSVIAERALLLASCSCDASGCCGDSLAPVLVVTVCSWLRYPLHVEGGLGMHFAILSAQVCHKPPSCII
jgi:hypothetical protein